MRLGSKLIEKNTPGTENISCFNNCNFAEVGPEKIVLLKISINSAILTLLGTAGAHLDPRQL